MIRKNDIQGSRDVGSITKVGAHGFRGTLAGFLQVRFKHLSGDNTPNEAIKLFAWWERANSQM